MTIEFRFTGALAELEPDTRARLVDRGAGIPPEVRETVAGMAKRVAEEGDAALLEFTRRFDDVDLEELVVPQARLQDALDQVPQGFEAAFEDAVDQIRAYHEALTIRRSATFHRSGIEAHERVEPVPSAGIYVPGGEAAYPSTVAMTVVPAQVAGVEEVTVASPPGPQGTPSPLVLAACRILDVERVVPVGGAQAILALATGTQSVPEHPLVVGPGNVYVQAAKQHVAGSVRIDAPAGPSEVAVLADESADPGVAARELVAQAEHDTDALAVALCTSDAVADAIHEALEAALDDLPRADVVLEALKTRGALLTVDTVDEAAAFLDELAPEHATLLTDGASKLAARLTGPACIVHGPRARVPLADYAAGPSHVLPTGRAARTYSGIGLETFTKRVHVVEMEAPDPSLTEAAAELARLEGLEGHARAIQDEDGGPSP